MLASAAAYGSEIDVSVLERVVAVEPLAEAVAAGVLVDDPWVPSRVRFVHELVRQALYDAPRLRASLGMLSLRPAADAADGLTITRRLR